MKGKVIKRGKTYTFIVDLPPDPSTGERNQKWKGGFRTKGDAERALADLLSSVNRGEYVAENNMTLAEFLDIWLNDYAKPKYKPTVFDVESTIINRRIIPVLGRQKIQQIKPLTITRFYNELAAEYSPDYVRHIHAILRKALRQALKWDMLAINPMDKVDSPKLKKKEMKVWTLEECLHFLNVAVGHVHYIVYSLAIHTGMRKGEILGLRWQDIDLEGKTISVRQTVTWTPSVGIIFQDTKTDSSQRRIAISNMLVQDLRQRKKQVAEQKLSAGGGYVHHDLVCSYENGEPIKPRRITETFEYLTKKADLQKIRFHDLRHSHASMLLNNDVNPKIGAERLGHSSVQIFLDRYAHLLPNMQRDAIDLIEAKMNAAKKSVEK